MSDAPDNMRLASCRRTPRHNFLARTGASWDLSPVGGALPSALYMADAGGRVTYYNEGAATLWGRRPELGKSKWWGSWKLHSPDGRPLAHDQCPMATTLRERLPIHGVEAVAERPMGSLGRSFPTLLLFTMHPAHSRGGLPGRHHGSQARRGVCAAASLNRGILR